MPTLQTGITAPDFELPDAVGKPVRLSQYRGVNWVVVYFYPKDDTSVCTKQACGFRDEFAKFRNAGAVILGISDDSGESHTAFAAKYQLPFTLLSDKGGRVRKLYGVNRMFGILPGRVTYVIDRDGVVRHVYSALFESDRHVHEALAALSQGGAR
jgi:peroxiredoxin Q/BCP